MKAGRESFLLRGHFRLLFQVANRELGRVLVHRVAVVLLERVVGPGRFDLRVVRRERLEALRLRAALLARSRRSPCAASSPTNRRARSRSGETARERGLAHAAFTRQQRARHVVRDRPTVRVRARRPLADGAHELQLEPAPAILRFPDRASVKKLSIVCSADATHSSCLRYDLIGSSGRVDLAAIAAVHFLIGADVDDRFEIFVERDRDRLRLRVFRESLSRLLSYRPPPRRSPATRRSRGLSLQLVRADVDRARRPQVTVEVEADVGHRARVDRRRACLDVVVPRPRRAGP